jgi:hypothetical protein
MTFLPARKPAIWVALEIALKRATLNSRLEHLSSAVGMKNKARA